MQNHRELICVCPTRNEAHNLPRFLNGNSLWADHIVVLDQCSDDDTRKLAVNHPKVKLVELNDPTFDENARAFHLFEAARSIAAGAFVVWIDADEVLASENGNLRDKLNSLAKYPDGTVFKFTWAHLYPDRKTAWIPPSTTRFACTDNGAVVGTRSFHADRVPIGESLAEVECPEIYNLHLNYLDEKVQRIKSCWYQFHEEVSPEIEVDRIASYRMYNAWWSRPRSELREVRAGLLKELSEQGVDLYQANGSNADKWVSRLFNDIHTSPVSALAKCYFWSDPIVLKELASCGSLPADPRNLTTKISMSCLSLTQPFRGRFFTRGIDAMLRRTVFPAK